MMDALHVLTGNRILNISVVAFAAAQVLKILIVLIQEKRFDSSRILGSGGMPSSHAATVCALAVAVAKESGTQTPQFAISFVFAMIVMYDASNVRRAAGEHAKILNHIMDHWNDSSPDLFKRDLKELLGHTPLQVLCGAILGIALGFLL